MIPAFVLAWAAQAGPSAVLAEARARLEGGRCGPRTKIVVSLTAAQRRQVGAMLDARWAAGGDPVVLGKLRAGLATHSVALEELLEAVGGPLRDLRAERAQSRQESDSDRAEARLILQQVDPRVPNVVIERCLAGAGQAWTARARDVASVVGALGVSGEHLAVLAARLFRDAHALDRSGALGRAVARFLSGGLCESAPDGVITWQDPVSSGLAWKEAWASRGVVCDEVSTQVLVLNLPLQGAAPAVHLAALRGEPVWLTLRSLRGGVHLAPSAMDVFVCENPSIVEAAADRLGPASRPLVCTFGVPSQAALLLLQSITGRASLHVRADEDTVGRRIVRSLLQLPGANTWRMRDDGTRYEEELLAELLHDLDARCSMVK